MEDLVSVVFFWQKIERRLAGVMGSPEFAGTGLRLN